MFLLPVAAAFTLMLPLALPVSVSTPTSPPTSPPTPTSLSSAQRDALFVCPDPVSDPAPGVLAPPVIRASGWLVADLDTGAVLAECDPHRRLAPASTVKVLTALALLPVVPATAAYVGRDEDARIDGTRAGIVPGQHYTGDQLWHGLLMGSANDCAEALARLAGGSSVATARMTALAQRLGARDTVVVNTSGLDAPGQVSSAFDLALFGRAALADPALMRYVSTMSYTFPGKSTGDGSDPGYLIANHNRLLHNYPGATGLKNGYTVAAGGTFIGSATRAGHRYLATILHSDGDTWREVAALLDWAFAHGSGARPVANLDDVAPVSVQSSATGPSATGLGLGRTAGTAAPREPAGGSGFESALSGWQYLAGFAGAAVVGGLVAAATTRRRRPRRPARR